MYILLGSWAVDPQARLLLGKGMAWFLILEPATVLGSPPICPLSTEFNSTGSLLLLSILVSRGFFY